MSIEDAEAKDRFAPMQWLLSRGDVEFFGKYPGVAAQFRRDRYQIFLSYLRDLRGEIAAYHRESSRLMASGAWHLGPHLLRERAVLLYHQTRLYRGALCYRWSIGDVSETVNESLNAVLARLVPVTN